jgi:hypothetical protein
MKHDKKNENAKRFNSKKNDDVVSNNNRENVDLDLSFNETSRTIYCAEKTNDTFFQNFSKENF